jgi:hypothetical protein
VRRRRGESAEEPPEEETFEPEKCLMHESGDEYSSVIKIGFIEIGENAGFVVTEYSDGSVTMMATNGAEIGATGGFGADAAWGELEAGAKVDFGANVEFDYGSTWHFEDMAQAESFREQLDDYLYDQWAMTHPVCGMGVCMPRPTTGAQPPPVPTTKFSGVALNVDVNAALGISRTTGTAPLTQASLTEQGIASTLSGSAHWTTTTDTGGTPDDPSDDTRTYVTDLSLNSEVTGQVALATGGFGSMVGMSYAVKKDGEGNIIEIQIVSTSEVTGGPGVNVDGGVTQGQGQSQTGGGGSVSGGTTQGDVVVTETTLAIDPDDAASQQTVRDWMGGNGDFEWPGLISLNMVDPSTADPTTPSPCSCTTTRRAARSPTTRSPTSPGSPSTSSSAWRSVSTSPPRTPRPRHPRPPTWERPALTGRGRSSTTPSACHDRQPSTHPNRDERSCPCPSCDEPCWPRPWRSPSLRAPACSGGSESSSGDAPARLDLGHRRAHHRPAPQRLGVRAAVGEPWTHRFVGDGMEMQVAGVVQ